MKTSIKNWLENHITLHENENPREERVNSWTHLAGALLALIGMVILVRSGMEQGNSRVVTGFVVFSCSMILLFSASGFYHLAKPSNTKRILRVLDHSNIYFLIAGTYTPVFIAMNIPQSNSLLFIIWGIALAGVLFSLIFWGRFGFLHVFLYLAMGWMVVFVRHSLFETIPMDMLKWIVAGGLTYTLGVVFYSWKKLPYSHGIWHLFVLAGCGLFYWGFLTELPRVG